MNNVLLCDLCDLSDFKPFDPYKAGAGSLPRHVAELPRGCPKGTKFQRD